MFNGGGLCRPKRTHSDWPVGYLSPRGFLTSTRGGFPRDRDLRAGAVLAYLVSPHRMTMKGAA